MSVTLLGSLAVLCSAAFFGTFVFWRSSFVHHVMSRFWPTVGGLFSILAGPITAMIVYVHLPLFGVLASVGLVFYAVIVLCAALFGIIAGYQPDSTHRRS